MFKNKDIYITNFDHERLLEMLIKLITGSKKELTSARDLSDEIKRAKKVDSHNIPADYVTMNSVFELKGLEMPDRRECRLVFPEESDPDNGKISILSPIGMAVLGYRKGEIIKFNTPAGEEYYQIEKVIYQPEAAGDYHL
ncbi:MAG: GreA/GreB family elongation factor [Spirochaetes bacterium]|nr:GreA/GreB family elongation factor [Spirochaetota bacterium]